MIPVNDLLLEWLWYDYFVIAADEFPLLASSLEVFNGVGVFDSTAFLIQIIIIIGFVVTINIIGFVAFDDSD